MYKLDLADNAINLGVIITTGTEYLLLEVIGGKICETKRLAIWNDDGYLIFFDLVIISLFINKDSKIANDAITLFLMCVGGGTLGGMLG